MIYLNTDFNFDGFIESEATERAYDVQPADNEGEITGDNGLLNVSHGGNKFIFDLGKELPESEFDSQANAILESIGVVGRFNSASNY
jgi:hypothetical protein